nr:bacteriocin [uncultured Draconibacterium sp.]
MKEKFDFNISGAEEMSKEELMEVEGGMKFWKALLGFAISLAIGLIATGGDGTF